MWWKVSVSKKICDGERNVFWNEGRMWGVFCKNILLADLLLSPTFEILQTSLIFKNSESVVTSGWFEKLVGWRAQIFFLNDGGI